MKILAVTERLLRVNLGRPQILLIFIAFPLVFTFVFGGLLSGSAQTTTYEIALHLPSNEGAYAELDNLLSSNPRLKITKSSEQEARELVHDRKVYAAVLVPAGLDDALKNGTSLTYTLVREEENNIYLAAKEEIDQAFYQLHTAGVVARQLTTPESPSWDRILPDTLYSLQKPKVTLDVTPLSRNTDELSATTRVNIGFTLTFIMMSLIATIGVMLQERLDGTWQRLLATPIRRSEILSGYLLAYFILGWLQFGILVITSKWLFDIYWGNPLGLFILGSAFILCSISLGLALGGLVKTFQQQQAIASILVTATSMLAGVYWPLELEPQFMQNLARGLPQYWAMEGFNDLLLRGLDWQALAPSLAMLSAFTLVFFLFGVWRIRFD